MVIKWHATSFIFTLLVWPIIAGSKIFLCFFLEFLNVNLSGWDYVCEKGWLWSIILVHYIWYKQVVHWYRNSICSHCCKFWKCLVIHPDYCAVYRLRLSKLLYITCVYNNNFWLNWEHIKDDITFDWITCVYNNNFWLNWEHMKDDFTFGRIILLYIPHV